MSAELSAHTLFNDALEISDPAARERYLQLACAGHGALYERIQSLLSAHYAAGGFFSQPSQAFMPGQLEADHVLHRVEMPGDLIGRYRLQEQIGEGGCGIVYAAEQQHPVRRQVALKVIKLGMDTRQVVARFEAERQALALMDHPNIARVLDAGSTDSGRPFFVMELVHGLRITDFCDQHRLPARQRLELFILICEAVQHAHQKGIIHRDLKPSNILVSTVDGTPLPKVIDFGIAKATDNQPLTDKTVFTALEQFIGTPAYMSPEQAELTGAEIDTRTDIYSLGVVLYELLTGKTPFNTDALQWAGLEGIRRAIREQQPTRPSTRLRGLARADLTTTAHARRTDPPRLILLLRGDLDWIVMKCLEKDRKRRYATAHELAADIRRTLDCEPVIARPPSRLYEFQKTVRRHKVGFAATAGVIVALAAGLAMTLWLLGKERQSRERAVVAERESARQLYSALLGQSRATVRSGELGQRVQALAAIRQAAAISNSAELRREVVAALALPDLRFERDLPKPRDSTFALLDPALARLALGHGASAVEIRSVLDDQLLASLPPSTTLPAHLARWSPDGEFLAVKRDQQVGGFSATLEVWSVAAPQAGGSGPRRVLFIPDLRWDALAFHPREPQIILGREGGWASICDLRTGSEVARFKLHDQPVDIQFSPDGKRFAVLHRPGSGATFAVHDAASGVVLASQSLSDSAGRGALAWHPHGRWIATVDETGAVCLLDSRTGELRALGQHKSQAVTAVFSPDGGYLFTGSWDRELICWDVQRLRAAFTMAVGAFQLQLSRNGDRCAAITREGPIKFYAFERPIPREFPAELGTRVRHATFSPDGRWIAAAGLARGGVWDLSSSGPAAVDPDARQVQFFFGPNGEVFGSRNEANDRSCFRWRFVPAANSCMMPKLHRLDLWQPKAFTFMACSSNFLVMTSTNGSQTLAAEQYEAGSEHWTLTYSGLTGLSPDGRWLAIYQPFTPWLCIYRMPGIEYTARLKQAASIADVQFSPTGDEVAAASPSSVEIWSTSTWQRRQILTNFCRILYTPDPRIRWLTKDIFTAGLYDRRSIEPLLSLPAGMLPLAVSDDGRYIAMSIDARQVQIWDWVAVRQHLDNLGLGWD